MANFVPVLGLRGTGSWETDERPKNWREGSLLLFPNGDAPLTAMLGKLASKSTDDQEINWWEKDLGQISAALTDSGVYTDAALSNAYSASDDQAAGTKVYAKMALADIKEYRPGHKVMLADASDQTNDLVCKCTAVVKEGASSYLALELLEADGTGAGDLSDADRAVIMGNLNPQGGEMPVAISYNPVKRTNFTNIWRTPHNITRTARKTRVRSGNDYEERKRESQQYHMIEQEKDLWFGVPTEGVGSNGEPETTVGGIRYFIKTYASENFLSYVTDTDADFAGKTWIAGGEAWLAKQIERIFRFGSTSKVVFAGSTALEGLNVLARTYGQFELVSRQAEYGIKVRTWITAHGDLNIITHPLWNNDSLWRANLAIIEPKFLKWRPLDDTMFIKDPQASKPQGRARRLDSISEEWLTEASLEVHHPQSMGFLSGIGSDNTVTP